MIFHGALRNIKLYSPGGTISIVSEAHYRTAFGNVRIGFVTNQATPYYRISADHFELIAEPIHFALLALMDTRAFRYDVPWIAKKLGLSERKVKDAIRRLMRLGLVETAPGGSILPKRNCETTQDVPSEALRRFHLANIRRATRALRTVPLERRDITSITMAIAPDRIPLAKQLIGRFRKQMAALLEEGDRSEVYLLNVQLVPCK